jgi:hypothetical protein
MPYDNAWASAWAQSADVNVGTQVQNVTAFNGAGNINGGDFSVAALQDVGDSGEPVSGYGGWGDVNVGTQVQNVTAFNGAGNVNGGDFTVFADQNVGDAGAGGPINDYAVDVDVDVSNGVNVGVQVQNVTAFNGAGNINGANYLGGADQGIGDESMPTADMIPY